MNGFRVTFAPATHRLAVGASVVALYTASAAGAAFPDVVRLGLALAAFLLWPGAMALRFAKLDVELEWPGRIAASMVLGLLLAMLVALASHFLRFDAAIALWALPLGGLTLALFAPAAPAGSNPRALLPWALLVVWVVLVGAVVGSLGAPLVTDADSPDHIGTIRRIVETREPFPTDAFFRDAGPGGADPRKGLYHPVVALLCRVARLDPVTTWRLLPLFFIPLFLLAQYVFAVSLTRSRMTGLVAAVLFPLAYGGGPGGTELREAVYSTRVGEVCALLAAAALVRFIDNGGRRRAALFLLLALASLLVHVWYALYFAIAFGAYAVVALVAGPFGARLRRFAVAAGALLVVAGPYLAFRAQQAYGPRNPIHTDPQGLLYLTDRLYTVDPQAMWTWYGVWLVVALLAIPYAWSRRRETSGWCYLCAVTPAVLLLILNPFVLPFLERKLGYLTMRFIWIAPVVPAAAAAVTGLGSAALRGRGARRAWASLGLGACVLALVPAFGHAVTLVTERRMLRAAEAERSAGPWADVLAFLAARYPVPVVIAADPATSYSIPAYTGHQVMAFFDQHSSPNDARGLTRILDARTVLSPFSDLRQTLEVLRAYGVDLVVVNQRVDRPVSSDYWAMSPDLTEATHAKFARHPEWFMPVYESPGAWVFAVTEEGRHGPLPEAGFGRTLPPPGEPLVAADSARAVTDGLFTQFGTRTDRARYAPGDTIRCVTVWGLAGASAPPPGNYSAFVRLESAVPRGALYADAWDKPYRKALEKISGTRWRVRTNHRPLDGVFAPDQWTPGTGIEDRYDVVVPANAAPGEWVVRLRMVRLPHYVNTSVRDYLRDDDAFNGPIVARIVVAPRRDTVSPAEVAR